MADASSHHAAQSQRAYLASRRVNRSEVVQWQNLTVLVCVGFDHAGIGRELFIETSRPGSDLDVLVSDAAILASMLLQHGYRLEELFAKLMRADLGTAADRFKNEATGARKPSLIAAVFSAAIHIELEEGDALRAAAELSRGNSNGNPDSCDTGS